MDLMIKLQLMLQNFLTDKVRANKKYCNTCKEDVLTSRQVSIVNILVFILISAVLYFVDNRDRIYLLLPVVLGVLNSLVAKRRCPKCFGTDFTESEEGVEDDKDNKTIKE